jgi:glycerol-3-phosphate dehydrogenase subunit B
MTDVLIIGAGLAGWSAAHFALERGARVTLVCEGRGGLALSHGCIDVLRPCPTRAAIEQLPSRHPYRLLGWEALCAAIDAFARLMHSIGHPYSGDLHDPWRLPSARGSVRSPSLVPEAQRAGDVRDPALMALASLQGFRDFDASFACQGLRLAGLTRADPIDLPLPDLPDRRDLYATDLARLFDDHVWRARLLKTWAPRLRGLDRLGLPAVLGLQHPSQVLEEMTDALQLPLFEIPGLPPSVPGLRLEQALRRAALDQGAHLIEGSRARGRPAHGRRLQAIDILTAGGPRLHRADAVILATGGALHGGLVYGADGTVTEPVFGLPVLHKPDRRSWIGAGISDQHPYASFGVEVGPDMRPIKPGRHPAVDNLFLAGGVLAHADPVGDGSRQGIDLATAFRAVEGALA